MLVATGGHDGTMIEVRLQPANATPRRQSDICGVFSLIKAYLDSAA